jgi:cell cycle related kinase
MLGPLSPQVLLARVVQTGELVAQKRVFVKRATHGIPDNLLREVKSMQAVSHPNVVELRDVFAQVR